MFTDMNERAYVFLFRRRIHQHGLPAAVEYALIPAERRIARQRRAAGQRGQPERARNSLDSVGTRAHVCHNNPRKPLPAKRHFHAKRQASAGLLRRPEGENDVQAVPAASSPAWRLAAIRRQARYAATALRARAPPALSLVFNPVEIQNATAFPFSARPQAAHRTTASGRRSGWSLPARPRRWPGSAPARTSRLPRPHLARQRHHIAGRLKFHGQRGRQRLHCMRFKGKIRRQRLRQVQTTGQALFPLFEFPEGLDCFQDFLVAAVGRALKARQRKHPYWRKIGEAEIGSVVRVRMRVLPALWQSLSHPSSASGFLFIH